MAGDWKAETEDAPLVVRLFGPFEARVCGATIPTLSRKGQWLLALLVLRGGTAVERSWLAGTLWPDSSRAQSLRNLRNTLTELRRALGSAADCVCAPSPRTLAFDAAGADVDLTAFDSGVGRGDPAALERSVALYRGPLLEGCVEEWVLPERENREQAYLQALETLAHRALEDGDHGTAGRYLRRVVAVDPLREGAQRALMQALAAGGNDAAALVTYRDLRLRLHRELNAEPDRQSASPYPSASARTTSRMWPRYALHYLRRYSRWRGRRTGRCRWTTPSRSRSNSRTRRRRAPRATGLERSRLHAKPDGREGSRRTPGRRS